MKKTIASSILALTLAVGTAAQAAKTAQPAKITDAEARQRHLRAVEKLMANNSRSAISILSSLSESTFSADEKDRVLLSLGRAYYQAGQFPEAIDAFEKVRSGGPSWLESLEERSWALLRNGEDEKALALLKTVLSPIYQDKVQSEPYFLASFGYLRTCDYPSVLRTIQIFKERFRPIVVSLENSKDPAAKAKLEEIQSTIHKINLVDAEVIQRLFLDSSGKRQKGDPPKIARGRNDMSFPADPLVDDKEVWLDEIENYRVTVKGCPQPEDQASSVQKSKENAL